MKNYNKILEAVNRGIKFALDDFDDQEEIQGQTNSKVSHVHGTKEYIDLLRDTVDFNLPSGNLWYKCNLGASNPTESATWPHEWFGNYYAWGETETKDNYSMSKYKFAQVTYINQYKKTEKVIMKYTKYCNFNLDGYNGYTDNLTQLEPEDDAAHVKLGQNYYIPTTDDFKELFKYTTQEYKRNYCKIKDLNGVLFTSINDNSKTMFVPCAGLRCANTNWNPNGESCIGFEVHLWTSTFGGFNTGRASSIEGRQHEFDAGWGKCEISNDDHRFYGLPLRPVYKQK